MSNKGKYWIDDDGILKVRKMNCHRIKGYQTFFPDREYDYPCMDMDGDSFFLLTVIGGWFGLHKFITRHYLSGIMYATTCGFCGVFYICDLIAILFGNYVDERISFEEDLRGHITQRKERFFNRPVKNRIAGLMGIVVAVVVSLLAVMFIYIPFLAWISGGIINIEPNAEVTSWIMEVLR